MQSYESKDLTCLKDNTVIPTVWSKVGQLKSVGSFSKTLHVGESLSNKTRASIVLKMRVELSPTAGIETEAREEM